MTLIAVYNSRGLVGRCDARCYNASQPECTCCCGGINHGCGKDQAIENTEKMVEEKLKEHYGEDSQIVKAFHEQLPLGLFPGEQP
jgi:hypothetical protein